MALDLTGKTALITGASSGIGVEYAKEFARRGSNVVLVARRKDRLDAVAALIRAESQVTVTVVAQDLSTPNSAAELEAKLSEHKSQVPEFPVVVRGDRATQYMMVMEVLDVLGRLDIKQIGLATQAPK